MPVWLFGVVLRIEDMAKQLLAKSFQQIVLGFKMGIKCGSANVGGFYDLVYRDLVEILLREQLGEGIKNSLPSLSLASVHNILRTFFEFCSVTNSCGISYVAVATYLHIIITELFVQ